MPPSTQTPAASHLSGSCATPTAQVPPPQGVLGGAFMVAQRWLPSHVATTQGKPGGSAQSAALRHCTHAPPPSQTLAPAAPVQIVPGPELGLEGVVPEHLSSGHGLPSTGRSPPAA